MKAAGKSDEERARALTHTTADMVRGHYGQRNKQENKQEGDQNIFEKKEPRR
jgi:hypothetical protein